MSQRLPLPVRLADRILRRSSRPLLLVGSVTSTVLLTLFYSTGVLFPDLSGTLYFNSLEITGLFLLMALLPAYLLMCLVGLKRSQDRSLKQLQQYLADSRVLSGRYRGAQFWPWVLPPAWLFALTANVNWSPVRLDPAAPAFTLSVMLIAGQLLLWSTVSLVLFIAIHQCWFFNRLASVVRFDILRPEPMNPFGRVALGNLLLIVGALALTTLQSLDQEFRSENYLNALYVGVPAALVMIILPIWPIHRRMRQARADALKDVEKAIASTPTTLDQEPLQQLNGLLARREYLQSARTWPMDLSIFSRLLLYGFIPPVAWVGAALVEFFLDARLSG